MGEILFQNQDISTKLFDSTYNHIQPSLAKSDGAPEEALKLQPILSSSSLPTIVPITGWYKLPVECLENIIESLDDDTQSLARLLQVSRQWFFLVVPKLYKDPFKRIVDDSRHKCNNLRISSTNGGETGKSFQLNQSQIFTLLTTQHQTREVLLYLTLFSTLIQRLCIRFPLLHSHFYGGTDNDKNQFDFGPYHRQVTWTSQCYLRHLTVIDLERLWTRLGNRQSITTLMTEACSSNSTELSGKYGIFPRVFSPNYTDKDRCSIGLLDYLQRAILVQPGTDRIQSLRIPAHRMKTYQQRHERISEMKRQASKETPDSSRNSPLETVHGTDRKNNKKDKDADESNRPYCFTFDKLSNLRQLEVCLMNDNRYGWETLESVLSTLLTDNHKEASKSDINEESKQPNHITKFSVHSQCQFSNILYKILLLFKHLEILELKTDSGQNLPSFYAWLSVWDDDLCRKLRVLRIGTSYLSDQKVSPYESLGKLANLEELRVGLNNPEQIKWIVNTKRNFHRSSSSVLDTVSQSCEQSALGMANNTFPESCQVLSKCLPKLRKLGCNISGTKSQMIFEAVSEAFCDQLEELSVCFNYNPENIRFEHPFTRLTRLAIRGLDLTRLDFVGLVQCCTTVELLVLENDRFSKNQDIAKAAYDGLADALTKLKFLRCLYLEGTWNLQDGNLLKIAQESESLYKLSVFLAPKISFDVIVKADKILCNRKSKYPLKPRGIYRLSNSSTAKDYIAARTFFGYDD